MSRASFCIAFLASCSSAAPPTSVTLPLPPVAVSATAAQAQAVCQDQDIPNTTVCDTPAMRAIIAFAERYRVAMEQQDAATLLALASPRYKDDTTDYAGLAARMDSIMQGVKNVRYEAKYRDVRSLGDGTIAVDYDYASSFLMKQQWHHSAGTNTLVLEPHGSSFLILRGM
jgi:hypothetical protein